VFAYIVILIYRHIYTICKEENVMDGKKNNIVLLKLNSDILRALFEETKESKKFNQTIQQTIRDILTRYFIRKKKI
jgi:hypothetical protein